MSRRAVHALLALALSFGGEALALDPGRRPDLYTQEVWLAGQALPAGRLRTIYQSFDGYLWIGSYDGLVRFDGTRFVSFGKHELPSLRSNVVNVILEDRQGVLWIGTQAGLTRLFRDGTAATLGTEDGLPHPRVNALVEDPEGGLWVGTEGGLLKLRAGRPTVYGAADGLPSAAVLALAAAPDGTVWIGTRSGLVSFREGRFTSYGPKDGLLGDQVTALYADRDGSLLMGHGTVEGYTVLKDGVFSTRTVKDGLPHGTIELFLRDRDGNLWLGSWTGGLSRIFEGRVDVFGEANAPLDDGVVSILEDREGSLWVATVGGLVRLHDGRFTVWSRRNGLVSDTVRSIWTDPDGTVWLGGTPGLHRIRDGRLEVLKGPEGDNRMLFRDGRAVRTDRLRQTGGSARGTLWLGTGRGLFRGVESGTSFSFEEVLGGYVVDSMVEEPDGTYLIGTNGAGLLRFDGRKVVKVYRKEDGLPANHIGTLLRRKKDGALWIATYGGGLALFEKGAFRSFGREEGLADLSLMALWEDEHGDLFVGTNGGGLLRFTDGRFARIGRAQGLPDDNIFAILEGEPGVVYLTSNAGIFRVSRADLDAVAEKRLDKLPLEIYGLADGLLSVRGTGGSLPQAARAANGTLWFATVRGAAVLDPSKHPPRAAPPNVVVEDARVDGVARSLTDLALESGPRTLEIAYTAFGFRAPSRMHFRYRLEGWDPDWVDAGSRRTAFYTGLPPGRYRFRVLAANADGVWNEKGASVEVEVTPRLFETWTFRGAVLAFGVGLSVLFGALVQRARTKGLRARQHDLQEEVERRTRALREANEKLVRLNDGKNEFLGIAAHDLQNPLTAVSGFAQILREQPSLPPEERDSLLARIVSASTRMSALVKNLLEVNALERGSVTAKLSDVDAIAVMRDVAELFRPRAEVKRQPLVVEATSLPLLVRADPSLLHEVLENLVSNAIKYSPPGRPVRLAVKRVAARVRIEVEDQGPGLTEEDRERLFQPFARLSARPTAGEPSTGLGLSIVKRLVEVMEGTITCKSTPGRGTTFTVELPVSP